MGIHYIFQILFIIITLNMIWTCNGQLDEISRMMQQRQQENFDQIKKYCGKHLTDALAALCHGNYQTLRPVRIRKKNYWESQFYSDMPADHEPADYPFQNRQEAASSMLGNFGKKRRRRGVYNECCEKSCTREQLSMYCAAPMGR